MDAIGTNGGALHALWTLHGLGELTTTTTRRRPRAAVEALRHPAAGVRKAAAMVLPRDAGVGRGHARRPALLRDPDLHTRLAALLALADMPASPEIGRALYAASRDAGELPRPLAEPRALRRGAPAPRAFLTEYRADPAALPVTALPVRAAPRQPAARLARARRRRRSRRVEGHGGARQLGVARACRISTAWCGSRARSTGRRATRPRAAQLGRIGNAAESLGERQLGCRPPPATARRTPRRYTVPAGALRTQGTNTITVRVQNNRGDGGF